MLTEKITTKKLLLNGFIVAHNDKIETEALQQTKHTKHENKKQIVYVSFGIGDVCIFIGVILYSLNFKGCYLSQNVSYFGNIIIT